MKTKILVLLFVIVLCLTACGNEADSNQGVNKWQEINENKAKEIYQRTFLVPEGTKNVRWSMLKPEGEDAKTQGALIELSFDLGRVSCTAREQKTEDEQANISIINYDWTFSDNFAFSDKKYKDVKGKCYRYIGENKYVDLCTWYDKNVGVSYCLSVIDEDLDGFDITAVAESMMP